MILGGHSSSMIKSLEYNRSLFGKNRKSFYQRKVELNQKTTRSYKFNHEKFKPKTQEEMDKIKKKIQSKKYNLGTIEHMFSVMERLLASILLIGW